MITRNDLKNFTERELLDLVEQAKGHTKDFQETVGADFSYSALIDEITARGGKNGWYFDTQCGTDEHTVIPVEKQGETIRKPYTVSKDIAEEWSEFMRSFPVPSVALGSALSRFMADYRNGRIEFRISAK